MSERRDPPLSWAAEVPGLAGSVFMVLLFAATVAGRLLYPFDLEWMEGGMLTHGLRVQQGLPLYVLPSGDFIPFIYPPLYAWVLGIASHGIELGYPLGRAISVVGSVAAAVAVGMAAHSQGTRWPLSIGAGALFLSTYEDGGQFLDLVRIDGLAIGLVAWALVAGRHGWWRAAGVTLVLAYATKHSLAAFGLPILWWAHASGGRRAALQFVQWCVAPALVFTGLMLLEGDGLFLTYLLGVPGAHPLVGARLFTSQWELLQALPIAVAAAGVAGAGVVVFGDRAWLTLKTPTGGTFWMVCGGLAIVMTSVMRAHHGGYLNVLIPGLWFLSLAGAVGLHQLRSLRSGPLGVVGTSLLLGVQLVVGRWSLDDMVPTAADVQAGERVVAAVAAIDGDVLAPWNPWIAVQAGKAPGFHLIALWDVADHEGPLKDAAASIDTALAERRWSAVLTSNDKLGHGLNQAYTRGPGIRPAGKLLTPRTGWPVRPARIWYAKPE